jgi:hypothetical protein
VGGRGSKSMKRSEGKSGGQKGDDEKEQQTKPKDVGICRFKRLGQEAKQDKGARTADNDRTTIDAESAQVDGLSSTGNDWKNAS